MSEAQQAQGQAIKLVLAWVGIGGGGYAGYYVAGSVLAAVSGAFLGGLVVLIAAVLLAPTAITKALALPREFILMSVRGVFVLDVLYLVLTFIFNDAITRNARLDAALHILAWLLGGLTLLAFVRIGQWRSGRL